MEGHRFGYGPDPSRVATTADLVRELGLLRARAARGTRSARVSLEELSGRLNEPKSTIHSYLSGRRLPPAQLLDRMVIALGCSPTELHEWAEAWYRVSAMREATRRGPPPCTPVSYQPPHQLPLPVDELIGRADELAELDDALVGGRLTRVALVSGTAGVGKTALALHWAHLNGHLFPDGQLYVDLRGFDVADPVQPAAALHRLLDSLGGVRPDLTSDVEALASEYRSLLSGRQMLILLDNCSDAEQVRLLMPGTSSCAVVATSRDGMPSLTALHGGHRVDVPVLRLADATRLLGALIEQHNHRCRDGSNSSSTPTESELVLLAERCARLPVALRLAADQVGSQRRSACELAADLADPCHQLDALDAGDNARSAIRTIFSWSYRRLPTQVAAVFRLLALVFGVDLTADALAALLDTTVWEAHRCVEVLVRTHLVRTTRPGQYGLHTLLRGYACELLTTTDPPAERGLALTRLVDYYLVTTVHALDLLNPVRPNTVAKLPRPTAQARLADAAAALLWIDSELDNLLALTARLDRDGLDPRRGPLRELLSECLDCREGMVV